jgi:ABC-type amino acid transport substrate-binding protein
LYLAIFLPFALSIEPSAWIGFGFATGFSVALGEATVLILLGLPLFFVIESQPRLRQLIQGGAK